MCWRPNAYIEARVRVCMHVCVKNRGNRYVMHLICDVWETMWGLCGKSVAAAPLLLLQQLGSCVRLCYSAIVATKITVAPAAAAAAARLRCAL